MVNAINAMPEEARKMDIALHEKGNKAGLNEMYIRNNNGFLELDDNLINLGIVNYKITNHLYQSRITLFSEYQKNGFTVTNVIEKAYTDDLAINKKARISFKDMFCEYARFREANKFTVNFGNINDRIALIEREKPFVREAYETLGIEKVKALNYNVTNIKRAIFNKQTNYSLDKKIMLCLKEAGISEGMILPAKEVKALLQEIYNDLEVKNVCGKTKAAKATDLGAWFEIARTSPKIKGKTTDCIAIKCEKIIFL